jgi:hypothetical protein
MEFEWPGFEVDGEIYCCEACSLGQPCVCPQHDHSMQGTEVPAPTTVGEPVQL